jgi:hypothetical protein
MGYSPQASTQLREVRAEEVHLITIMRSRITSDSMRLGQFPERDGAEVMLIKNTSIDAAND